jgi:hypothetical protein
MELEDIIGISAVANADEHGSVDSMRMKGVSVGNRNTAEVAASKRRHHIRAPAE